MIQIEPYLFFNGRCEEAIQFYQQTLGAEVQMMLRNRESPVPQTDVPEGCGLPPGMEDKVMHATLRIGNTNMMMSDGLCDGKPVFEGFRLSFNVADAAAADRLFNALGAGGSVQMPLAKTFWSPCFGMLTDRFGVGWMISAAA
jgi:PhnB protein